MTSYGKKLRIVYVGALFCIATLSIASHWYLHSLEEALASDSPVMNAAGGQRMLSQRIASLSQQVYYELVRGDFEMSSDRGEELRAAVDQWQTTHRALVARQGTLGLAGSNSFEIAKSLALLDVHIETAVQESLVLLEASADPATFQGEIAMDSVAMIVQEAGQFLTLMEGIVAGYEAESRSKLERLQTVEVVTTYLGLALLGFLAFMVFEPAIRMLARQESDLLALRSAVDKHTIFSATDSRGRIIDVNDGFCEISGYSRDELIGASFSLLNSEQHSREFWNEQWKTIKAGDTWRSEVCNRAKDGTQYWVDSTNIPQFDAEGNIERFISLSFNITEKKRAEAAQVAAHSELEAQRAEQRAIIDAIPSNVWCKDLDHTILDCNIAAARWHGASRESLIGKRTTEVIPGEVGDRFTHAEAETITSGEPEIGVIEEFTTPAGVKRCARIDRAPLHNAAGEIDRLVVISTDITDLVQTTNRLREAEARLDMALTASSTGLWDCNLETGEDYFNHVVLEIIGYEPDELELTIDTWKSLCHPDDLPEVSSALGEHIAGQTATYSCEYRVRRKDESYVWIRDVGQVVERDSDDKARRIVGVYTDIQAVRDALGEAERSHAEMEQSQQRFELAIEGSRDAIFDWNPATGEAWFSPRWLQLLKTPQGALGSSIPDLLWHVAPEDAERLRLELDEFVKSDEERFDSEFQLVNGNDDAVWVMMRAVSFRDEAGKVTRVAGSVADITTLKEAQEAMQRLVQQDHLTGLASRTRLTERLEHAVKRCKRNGNHCGVLFFDFDRFKVVNDSLGHDVGDELLCSIAERLRSNVREVDTPARFGGDEFVILLEDLDDPASARIVADQLLDICAVPHQIRGHSLVSTASIGLVTSEHENSSAGNLLRYADVAMYEAKRNGRACVVEFDQAMFDAQQKSAELEEELQSAIELDQLELHYQVVIDLQTGAIASAEALLRWIHPTKGSIPPGDFISIAEESKQIVTIGEWVIEEACRQLVDWRRRGVVSEDFAVSINASKVQLLTPGFEKILIDHVDSYGLPRNVLKIEVTETTIVDNRSDIGDVLRSLRDQSIVIMMDDFGTGHSSLSVLHNLPIDELKIDQSFIRHADKSRDLVAITSSIVTLAEHLSLKTIGEGIEGQEHVALLQTLGCTYGQGYFWSKPVPAAEVEELFQGERRFSPAHTA